MALALKSYLIYSSWNKEQKEAEIWFLSVCFKKTHVKQDSCACMPVCLQWNRVLKRIQLHYIYNYVLLPAPSSQHVSLWWLMSLFCVLISVLQYAALKKVDCPFPLLSKPNPSRDFLRLLLLFWHVGLIARESVTFWGSSPTLRCD